MSINQRMNKDKIGNYESVCVGMVLEFIVILRILHDNYFSFILFLIAFYFIL